MQWETQRLMVHTEPPLASLTVSYLKRLQEEVIQPDERQRILQNKSRHHQGLSSRRGTVTASLQLNPDTTVTTLKGLENDPSTETFTLCISKPHETTHLHLKSENKGLHEVGCFGQGADILGVFTSLKERYTYGRDEKESILIKY